MSPELQTFLQHIVNGISLGAIYSLIALGYTMVYGILQLINFAHSDVFMVGAYLGYFAGLWVAAGVMPDRPLLLIGLPLGLFLAVLNHRVMAQLFKREPAKVPEKQLLRAAILGAIAVAVALAWGKGWFTVGNLPPRIFYVLPTLETVKAIGVLLVLAGPVLLVMRGLGFVMIAGLALAGLLTGAVWTAFPWVATAAQSIQVGAIRAKADGVVTAQKIGFQVKHVVTIGAVEHEVGEGDEPAVKEKQAVEAGQPISAQVKAKVAGTVTKINRIRAKISEVKVDEATYVIPDTHRVLVKKDERVTAGQKLSSGMVLGTPVLVLVFSMLGCATLGFLIERTAYRPLRHAPRINSLITAIGMSLLLENSAQLIFGADPKAFPQIIPPLPPLIVGGIIIDVKQLTVLIVAVVLMMALQFIVYHTRLGLGMRAVSYNHAWAGLMGVPVDQVITATFMIGSSLAAAAGILVGVTYVKIDPLMGMLLGLKAFVAAVLGGIGNLPGALLGGLLMGLSEEMVAGYLSSNFRDAIAFLILILILLFRPAGLLGKAQVEKV